MIDIDSTSPATLAASMTSGKWQMASHLCELDDALVRVSHEPNSRLIIQWPPRHGKSTLCSVYFPVWYRQRFPRRNIMLWSATAKMAQRFSAHSRELVRDLGFPIDERTKGWEHWKIAGTQPNEGEFYSAGIGGGGTMGAGFHVGIIDDYFKNVEDALSETIRNKQHEWFLTSCQTRAEPGASLIIIATRWHRDDLIGFVLRHAEETGEYWELISKPAIDDDGEALWPDRWDVERLGHLRSTYMKAGYPWMWDALYQQIPPEVLDSEWDPAYFGKHIMFDEFPHDRRVRMHLLTLDPSVGSNERADYSAIVEMVVDTSGHCWIDADLQRRDGARQVKDVLNRCIQNSIYTVGVETNAFQGVLMSMFRQESESRGYYPHFHGIQTRTEKVMKIREAVTPFLNQGFLHFKNGSPGSTVASGAAAWLPEPPVQGRP